ncbi:hypothetical protein KC573_03925 [candidate division WWE3 bacterium]|uniref:tRNA_anti-like n=1 Tax=candidate division WWE3 bacterium TaxID=2053526 RepID=A0A955LWC1_UNCKA|nr:hypothetical protein [candidate division WWE3 bacterium]
MADQNHTNPSEGKKSSVNKIIIAVVAVLFLCGMCGVIGALTGDTSTTTETPVTNQNNSATDTTTDQNETQEIQENTEKAPQINYVVTDIKGFIDEYDNNQISAEKKYTDTYIETTGYIGNISEDILGDVYVTVEPVNDEYYFGTYLQCFVVDDDDVLDLSNGSQITVRGKVGTQDLGIVDLQDCSVVR